MNKDNKVIVQGITGSEATVHAARMLKAGTQIVGGVNARKAGTTVTHEDKGGRVIKLPVFGGVAEAMEKTGADVSIIFVPPKFAKDAIIEAIDAEIPLLVVITEVIPVQDTAYAWAYNLGKGGKTRIIGPNCPGIITPGQALVGITPANITGAGPVGLVSKSGTLTYQMMFELRDFGFTTSIGIGGDPVIGTTHIDAIEAFEKDPDTKLIVMIGEIGGTPRSERPTSSRPTCPSRLSVTWRDSPRRRARPWGTRVPSCPAPRAPRRPRKKPWRPPGYRSARPRRRPRCWPGDPEGSLDAEQTQNGTLPSGSVPFCVCSGTCRAPCSAATAGRGCLARQSADRRRRPGRRCRWSPSPPAVAAVPAETDEQRGTPAVAAGAAGISAAVGSSRAAGPAVADQQARVTAGPRAPPPSPPAPYPPMPPSHRSRTVCRRPPARQPLRWAESAGAAGTAIAVEETAVATDPAGATGGGGPGPVTAATAASAGPSRIPPVPPAPPAPPRRRPESCRHGRRRRRYRSIRPHRRRRRPAVAGDQRRSAVAAGSAGAEKQPGRPAVTADTAEAGPSGAAGSAVAEQQAAGPPLPPAAWLLLGLAGPPAPPLPNNPPRRRCRRRDVRRCPAAGAAISDQQPARLAVCPGCPSAPLPISGRPSRALVGH
ncbi:coA binding domain protein [Mycobacterium ulcerans str. Harvey]|uniref:CoA binding domain protein n=1 Tax=Mycobacterium ulcerans str. Harvey TaxID=1299332 RepID=A0ABP3A8T0_MYCUL|nr:coA binding domain protein [Mycobacterium ulcerans str. Harvey]